MADMNPIPWSKITQYGDCHGLNGEDMDDLHYLIRQADNAYLRRMVEKQKQKMKRK